MDAGLLRLTLPVQSARPASFDVLRLCGSERDAVLVSVRLSKLSQANIAARIGVSKQAFSKWLKLGVPGDRISAFCNVTGTSLLAQYHAMNRAYRDASGTPRESERIAQIAALAEVA